MGNPATVAQSFQKNETTTEKDNHSTTLSLNESIPQTRIVYDYITLLSFDESVVKSPYALLGEFLNFFEKVATSKNRVKILRHLFKNIADSPQVILDETQIPEASAYRELKRLEKEGYIETVIETTYSWKRPGLASSIIALPIYTDDHIIAAREREKERVKPTNQYINELYRITLDDFIEPWDYKRGVDHIKELLPFIKKQCSGYTLHDILFFTERVAEKLQKEGIPVRRHQ